MSYRILIVDDEIEVASMLQRFLQRKSYIVKPFSLPELSAHIEAHLRRVRREKQIQRRVFGDFAEAGEALGIIGEEAEGYYQGQKTALEVAEIIQSRVPIYVNED